LTKDCHTRHVSSLGRNRIDYFLNNTINPSLNADPAQKQIFEEGIPSQNVTASLSHTVRPLELLRAI
jgi:hypothetical protein